MTLNWIAFCIALSFKSSGSYSRLDIFILEKEQNEKGKKQMDEQTRIPKLRFNAHFPPNGPLCKSTLTIWLLYEAELKWVMFIYFSITVIFLSQMTKPNSPFLSLQVIWHIITTTVLSTQDLQCERRESGICFIIMKFNLILITHGPALILKQSSGYDYPFRL